jgi:hypothetical protein
MNSPIQPLEEEIAQCCWSVNGEWWGKSERKTNICPKTERKKEKKKALILIIIIGNIHRNQL